MGETPSGAENKEWTAPKHETTTETPVTADEAAARADQAARVADAQPQSDELRARDEAKAMEIRSSIDTLGVPKSQVMPDSGYANTRADASIQRDIQALSEEVNESISTLKEMERKYDLLDSGMKESLGLPEYFGTILATPGKEPTQSKMVKFFRRFTSSKRENLYNKAMELLAGSDSEGLPNPDGGIAVSAQADEAKARQSANSTDAGKQGGNNLKMG